jgi:ABC-type lipoprotein export system ATPase subunit
MAPVRTPIRIEINCQPGKKYKSIELLIWEDIPPFAVITGLNGSGKTQLLEVLAFKPTDTQYPQLGALDGINVEVVGDT